MYVVSHVRHTHITWDTTDIAVLYSVSQCMWCMWYPTWGIHISHGMPQISKCCIVFRSLHRIHYWLIYILYTLHNFVCVSVILSLFRELRSLHRLQWNTAYNRIYCLLFYSLWRLHNCVWERENYAVYTDCIKILHTTKYTIWWSTFCVKCKTVCERERESSSLHRP